MVFEFFGVLLFKGIDSMKETEKDSMKIKEVKTVKTVNKSPKLTSFMKKNKSIDDFMKHHVPWIL